MNTPQDPPLKCAKRLDSSTSGDDSQQQYGGDYMLQYNCGWCKILLPKIFAAQAKRGYVRTEPGTLFAAQCRSCHNGTH
ncbi:hypothetical protein IFM47457_03090 [Aspergillus lentulus]|nr:hypothetical protein IFM47457_03090 [Aspergillus lentulus]